jgi:type III pantothenate kinase
MLAAIDIGNTNIVIGVFQGDALIFEARIRTEHGRTVDEYDALISPLFERRLPKGFKLSRAVLCSVVPPVTADFERLITERWNVGCLTIGPGIKTGVPVKLSEPTQVGADRIVNAVAVKHLYGAPALVVDFGTATTFDYVGRDGGYEGGVIMPGVTVSLEALVRNTAKLPRIELTWPASVIGKSTVHAMQVGAVVGYVAAVEGIVRRIQDEVGPIEFVIATGGLGALVTEHTKVIQRYQADLTLQGMRILAGLNPAGGRGADGR